MPYFRITVNLKKKKSVTGIREMDANIDTAYRHFNKKIFEEYRESDVRSFDIVQVSKLSDDVKQYLKKEKRPPIQ